MKKIKYILCACLMMASLGMEAKSMKDLLVSMPDEVMPCLNKNMRLEFAELQAVSYTHLDVYKRQQIPKCSHIGSCLT